MQIVYSDEKAWEAKVNTYASPSLFLVGPSPRSQNIESWRLKAIEYLKKKSFKGTVFIPEHKSARFFNYDDQIEWELSHLDQADWILAWVPRDLKILPAFTTNVEFGMYLKSGKLLYGRPDDSPKNKYLDFVFKKYTKRDIANSLEQLIDQFLSLQS